MRRAVVAAALVLLAACSAGHHPAVVAGTAPTVVGGRQATVVAGLHSTVVTGAARATTTAVPAPPSTTAVVSAAPTLPVPVPTAPPTLAGCPPAPPGPSTGGAPAPPPWHPDIEIPDSALPTEAAPAPWASHVGAIAGKGMWVWQVPRTEGGDVAAIVRRAVASGLHQIWVRIGDSQGGFYAVSTLDALVPAAHRAGVAVIGWGFPYLYDPVADAVWTLDALRWSAPDGSRLDGYGADIEKPTEGVDLSARRVAAYLETVRQGAGDRMVVATVYPPTDGNWFGSYPYRVMARYVDAFAPMIYWECTDPAADALVAMARLSALRPVHVIGQAFSLADVGGRAPAPSAAETEWFLRAAQRGGALGASFWVWQSATPDEWAAIAAYPW